MWIEGEYGTYWCSWSVSGWTHVRANVRRTEKRWFGLRRGKLLWSKADREVPEKMHPKEMRAWFLAAVHEYEDYETAWGRQP